MASKNQSAYSDKLKDPRWQKKRLEIMQRDKFSCKLCGDMKTTLNIHHKLYISGNAPWDYDDSDLVTVCEHCHYEVEMKKGLAYFDDLEIEKIDGWDDGSRLMWIRDRSTIELRIYNKDNDFVNGYSFPLLLAKWLNSFISNGIKYIEKSNP